MKRFARSSSGVTLLEIMLVLAVAANILVMSIRFYQTATANQQANAALQMIEGITAAADSLKQATGSYSQGGVSTDTIQQLMPNQSMTSPWNTDVIVVGATDSKFAIAFQGMPKAVCASIANRVLADSRYVPDRNNRCAQSGVFAVWFCPLGC